MPSVILSTYDDDHNIAPTSHTASSDVTEFSKTIIARILRQFSAEYYLENGRVVPPWIHILFRTTSSSCLLARAMCWKRI